MLSLAKIAQHLRNGIPKETQQLNNNAIWSKVLEQNNQSFKITKTNVIKEIKEDISNVN